LIDGLSRQTSCIANTGDKSANACDFLFQHLQGCGYWQECGYWHQLFFIFSVCVSTHAADIAGCLADSGLDVHWSQVSEFIITQRHLTYQN